MDTGISYCGQDWAYISSDEIHWKTVIRKLADAHPDEVVITHTAETNGGYIVAKFPPKWLRIAPPRQVHYTDEQRLEMAARLRRTVGHEDTDDVQI